MTRLDDNAGSSYLITLSFVMATTSCLRAQCDWLLLVHLSMPGSAR